MTKYLMTLAVILVSAITFGQEEHSEDGINWVTLNEAQEMAKDDPRPIMVDVYTPWCGPCKIMMKNSFTDASVIEYVNEHFYAVKFNGEGNESVTLNDSVFTNPNYDAERSSNMRNSTHQLTRYFQVRGYPTIIFLDEETSIAGSLVGYRPPNQLLDGLKKVMEAM